MPPSAYQNFDLLITRSGDDYRAFVETCPAATQTPASPCPSPPTNWTFWAIWLVCAGAARAARLSPSLT